MRAFDSSIGRLLVVVLTVAIGLETMRSQSEFWLGVLATLTAAWVVHALATAVTERGPRRAFCLVFAVGTLGALGVVSGPWSDVAFRGDVSEQSEVQRIVDEGLPTTRALLWFAGRHVKPEGRATVVMLDRSGRPNFEVVLSHHRGWPNELEELTRDLDTVIRAEAGVYSELRKDYPTQTHTRFQTLDVYFHAAYLLLCLAAGGLAACLVLLARRTPPTSRAEGSV